MKGIHLTYDLICTLSIHGSICSPQRQQITNKKKLNVNLTNISVCKKKSNSLIFESAIENVPLTPVLGSPMPVLGTKVKLNRSVIRLFWKINLSTIKKSRRNLWINVVIEGVSSKITLLLRFTFLPKTCAWLKEGLVFTVPKEIRNVSATDANGWHLMISGVQKTLISGWYPDDILDIRLLFGCYPWYPADIRFVALWYPADIRFDILDIWLLDSIKTWLFSAIFHVYYSLTTVLWYLISRYNQQIFLISWWYLSDT